MTDCIPEPAVPISTLQHIRLHNRKRHHEALDIVKEHVVGAMGLGLLPVPVLDVIGITAVQLRMLRQLCHCYGVPYTQQLARVAVAGILATFLPVKTTVIVASLFKLIPGFGSLIAGSTSCATAGAIIYASGRLFIDHFEKGGDLLDLEIRQSQQRAAEYFAEGKSVTRQMSPG